VQPASLLDTAEYAAGAGLLQWVVAIKEYYVVAKDVEPLKKKVADMEKAQGKGEKELADINALLARLGADTWRRNCWRRTAHVNAATLAAHIVADLHAVQHHHIPPP
jgi:hypothetical protein